MVDIETKSREPGFDLSRWDQQEYLVKLDKAQKLVKYFKGEISKQMAGVSSPIGNKATGTQGPKTPAPTGSTPIAGSASATATPTKRGPPNSTNAAENPSTPDAQTDASTPSPTRGRGRGRGRPRGSGRAGLRQTVVTHQARAQAQSPSGPSTPVPMINGVPMTGAAAYRPPAPVTGSGSGSATGSPVPASNAPTAASSQARPMQAQNPAGVVSTPAPGMLNGGNAPVRPPGTPSAPQRPTTASTGPGATGTPAARPGPATSAPSIVRPAPGQGRPLPAQTPTPPGTTNAVGQPAQGGSSSTSAPPGNATQGMVKKPVNIFATPYVSSLVSSPLAPHLSGVDGFYRRP